MPCPAFIIDDYGDEFARDVRACDSPLAIISGHRSTVCLGVSRIHLRLPAAWMPDGWSMSHGHRALSVPWSETWALADMLGPGRRVMRARDGDDQLLAVSVPGNWCPRGFVTPGPTATVSVPENQWGLWRDAALMALSITGADGVHPQRRITS